MSEILLSKNEVWPIEKLHCWDKNPRKITDRDLERLKTQIEKLGSYKPLIVTEDGTILGGNMRFKALVDLGQSNVWVSIVDASSDDKKLEYALSDNDRAGSYVEQELMALLNDSEIDKTLYSADIEDPLLTSDLMDMYGVSSEDENNAEDNDYRLNVITIIPPETPKLKEHIIFKCETKEQYDRLLSKFGDNADINVLMEALGESI